MSAQDNRRYLANRIFGNGFTGWTAPCWPLSKADQGIIAYWEKHGHVERDPDTDLIRMTDEGREALR